MSNEKAYVVKVTVDPVKYAAEYGYTDSADAPVWDSADANVHAVGDQVPGEWMTATVEEPTDPLQSMGEYTRTVLLKEFDAWQANRSHLAAQEEDGGRVDYSDSDDDARDMLLRVVAALRKTDECSHGEDTVTDYGRVTCDWCGAVWMENAQGEMARVEVTAQSWVTAPHPND